MSKKRAPGRSLDEWMELVTECRQSGLTDAANKREEALTQERDNLKEEIDLLRKKLFGTSSEKRTLDIPGQLNFFNEAELEQDPEATKAEDLEALLPE